MLAAMVQGGDVGSHCASQARTECQREESYTALQDLRQRIRQRVRGCWKLYFIQALGSVHGRVLIQTLQHIGARSHLTIDCSAVLTAYDMSNAMSCANPASCACLSSLYDSSSSCALLFNAFRRWRGQHVEKRNNSRSGGSYS